MPGPGWNIGRGFLNFGPKTPALLPTASTRLSVDFAAVVTVPVYVLLISLTIETVLPSSALFFNFTSTWRHVGGFAGNAAVNFLFDLDAVQLADGLTDNQVRAQIGSTARTGRVPVTAGLHTFDVRISKFGAVGNTIAISPVALPDLDHTALVLEEQEA